MLTNLITFTFQPTAESHLRVRSTVYAISLSARMLLPSWYEQRVIDQVMYLMIYLFIHPFLNHLLIC